MDSYQQQHYTNSGSTSDSSSLFNDKNLFSVVVNKVPSAISDDSLDDHSLDDFQSVTLKLNDDDDDGPANNDNNEIYQELAATKEIQPDDDDDLLADNEVSNITSIAIANNSTKTTTKMDIPTIPTLNIPNKDFSSSSSAGAAAVKISITPNTPPSPSLSPDGQSTVSLNSAGGSPLFQSQKYRGHLSSNSNSLWRPQSPMPPKNEMEAKDFFAYRDSVIQSVLDEIQTEIVPEIDGWVHNTYLLTEIDHWDNEKERIVLTCDKSIIVAKYDFIAMMRTEELRRIPLSTIDKIIQGDLKYPERSLAPRLNGIAGGVVGVVKDCLLPRIQDTVSTVGNAVLSRNSSKSNGAAGATATTMNFNDQYQDQDNTTKDKVDAQQDYPEKVSAASSGGGNKTSIMSALKLDNFEPRARNVQGIRIMWNQDSPISFTQKWNPFAKTIPWITFTSHPLLWHKGGGGTNQQFDVESFSHELIDLLSHSGENSPLTPCRIEYKPIVIETYVGLASLVHNANDLGFYKVRGKVSF